MLRVSATISHTCTDSLAPFLLQHDRLVLGVILLLGLLIRLPFAAIDFHAGIDLQFYVDWARTSQTVGLANIYSSPRVDYPPLLLYLLSGAAWLDAQFPQPLQASALIVLIKLPALLADVLTAGLLAFLWERHSRRGALLAAAVYVFNPGMWYVSAYWAQTDSIYTLFLVAAVIGLERNKMAVAWFAFTLALATKLQSIALGPLMLASTLVTGKARTWFVALMILSVTSFILLAPWLSAGRAGEVMQAYTALPSEAPKVDVSAYNFWYLLRLGRVHEYSSTIHPFGLLFTYQSLGIVLFGLYATLVTALFLKRRVISLTAAALCLGLYMLLTQMHERYMFPVLALMVLACIGQPRLWWLYGLLSVTFLFNLITIFPFTPLLGTNLVAAQGTPPGVLALKTLSVLAAAINLACLGWLLLALYKAKRPTPSA